MLNSCNLFIRQLFPVPPLPALNIFNLVGAYKLLVSDDDDDDDS